MNSIFNSYPNEVMIDDMTHDNRPIRLQCWLYCTPRSVGIFKNERKCVRIGRVGTTNGRIKICFERTDGSIHLPELLGRPTIHHPPSNSQQSTVYPQLDHHLAILPTINYLLLIARSISISISININNTVQYSTVLHSKSKSIKDVTIIEQREPHRQRTFLIPEKFFIDSGDQPRLRRCHCW